MRQVLGLLVLFAGCGDELVCGPRTSEVDGVCVGDRQEEPEPGPGPSLEEALLAEAATVDCPGEGDGRLDLEAGCIEGACAGDPLSSFDQAFGTEALCVELVEGFPEYLECGWGNGVSVTGFDFDLDGELDEAPFIVSVDEPYDGSTADGVGLGGEAWCAVQSLGMPDELEIGEWSRGWRLISASWNASGVYLRDRTGKNNEPDGYIDSFTIYAVR